MLKKKPDRRGPLRAVVIGGSVGGLAAARVLSRSGFGVTVVERSPGPLEDRGAGLLADAALPNSVLGRSPNAGLPVLRLTGREVVVRPAGGPRPDGPAQVRDEPSSALAAGWGSLYRLLREEAPASVLSGAAVGVRGVARGVEVGLADGRTLRADLVVAADGYRSRLRGLVDPENTEPVCAGYLLWRGLLDEAAVPRALREGFTDGRMHLSPTGRTTWSSTPSPARMAPRRRVGGA
jgi:2-polyprenyl-6-methoxyphenol hydroxylase-like FAD-dependent oxidoreductase